MLEERDRPYRRLMLTLPTVTPSQEAGKTEERVQMPLNPGAGQAYVLIPVAEVSETARPERPAAKSRRWTVAACVIGGITAVGIAFGAATLTRPGSRNEPSRVLAGVPRTATPEASTPAPAAPAAAELAAFGSPVTAGGGQIILEPRDCATHGEGIHKGDSDVGYWNSPSAFVTWVVESRAAGSYALYLTRACGEDCGGDFEAAVGDQRLRGSSAGTGGWDRYSTSRLGLVELPRGKVVIRLRPTGKIRTALMSLQRLKLYPARPSNSAQAPVRKPQKQATNAAPRAAAVKPIHAQQRAVVALR